MTARSKLSAVAALLLTGCHASPSTSDQAIPALNPHLVAQAAHQAFLGQKTFDPWVLTSTVPKQPIPAYLSNGKSAWLVQGNGQFLPDFVAGRYTPGGMLEPVPHTSPTPPAGVPQSQTLDLKDGTFTEQVDGKAVVLHHTGIDWATLWRTSDIVIDGDPEAQQVTHANLFYLLSSTYPGSTDSLPPMGLSSDIYSGHIFWDAEMWMFPALIVQHPQYARTMVAYRFKTLAQAMRNARSHGYAGAEFPWEGATRGTELAPGTFAQERHVTADAAWAAWQYYLWTGDQAALRSQCWPILRASAQYWVSRVHKRADGRYHISGVVSPDESAGVVSDDAYTNAVVQASLRAAVRAAKLLGQAADPRWAAVADGLSFPQDTARGIPAENDTPLTDHFAAKQADTLLLLYPLNLPLSDSIQRRMLTFYAAHTIANGPAMTSSIEAVVAARLGLGAEARSDFADSYQPFERGPWDAFSEKRTTDTVYFLTGMGGCLQSVLYGFAGLHVYEAGETPRGARLAGDGVASLYADPHLPPGWRGLTLRGIRFRGRTLTLTIGPGDIVHVS